MSLRKEINWQVLRRMQEMLGRSFSKKYGAEKIDPADIVEVLVFRDETMARWRRYGWVARTKHKDGREFGSAIDVKISAVGSLTPAEQDEITKCMDRAVRGVDA